MDIWSVMDDKRMSISKVAQDYKRVDKLNENIFLISVVIFCFGVLY